MGCSGQIGRKGCGNEIPTLRMGLTDTLKPALWEHPSLTEVGQLFPILNRSDTAWAGLSRRVSRFKVFAGCLGIWDVALG